MKKDEYEDIKDVIEFTQKVYERELEKTTILTNNIIKFKMEDEEVISHIFDKILNLAYFNKDSAKELFDKLLNYTKDFNKDLANDYEKIFKKSFEEENISSKSI